MRLIIIVFFFLPLLVNGQTSGQVWSEIGVKGKLSDKINWGLELNTRFGSVRGVESFFPQVSIKFKISKWFRPSIDYRYILEKDEFTNYQPANRFMLNANFEKKFNKRWYSEFRLRYQYEFARWSNESDYEQSIDQVLRAKPQILYDIKRSIFNPYLNAELYYFLKPYDPRFSKLRIGLGTDLEISDPLAISIGYIYDRELDNKKGLPSIGHILTLSLKYKF